MNLCGQELCGRWDGDGNSCPCATFDLDPPACPQCGDDHFLVRVRCSEPEGDE